MRTSTVEELAADDIEVRKRAFERKARQATHQILFYLDLFYRPVLTWSGELHKPTDDVLRHESKSTLARIRALIDAVGYRADPVESTAWKDLRTEIEGGQQSAGDDADKPALRDLWPYRVDGGEELASKDTSAKLAGLRGMCMRVLETTAPRDLVSGVMHYWSRAVERCNRWLTGLLVIAAATTVFVWLPQVASLRREAGLGFAFVGLCLLVPTVAIWVLALWRVAARGDVYWWDFGGPAFRSSAARAPERGFIRFAHGSYVPIALLRRVLANAVLYAGVWLAVLGFGWLYWLQLELGDPIGFTVLLIGLFLFFVLGAAQALDVWDFYDPAPVRLNALGLLLVAFAAFNSFKVWLAPAFLGLVFVITLVRFLLEVSNSTDERLWDRVRTNGRSAVFVIGLFVCAVLATNIGLTQFGEAWDQQGERFTRIGNDEWPMHGKTVAETATAADAPVVVLAASGGGSRAAIYTAHTLLMLHEAEYRDIGCNLQAISSVSGGSLTNAVYVAERIAANACDEALFTKLKGTSEGEGIVAAVAGDFLQPTIWGALSGILTGRLAHGGRSERVEKAWRDIGLDVPMNRIADRWRRGVGADGYPPLPLPMFNSTSIDTFDVVISPMQWPLYTDHTLTDSALGRKEPNLYDQVGVRYPRWQRDAKSPTWVYYRDGIYGLDDLLPNFTPNLAQSVRASANFPFGFPLVHVQTSQGQVFSPYAHKRAVGAKELKEDMYLTDGGVLSNSGAWSLYHLLRNRHDVLAARGVLVVVVDASRMQNYKEPSRIRGLMSAIDSQQPVGQSLHRRMFEALRAQYGARIQIVQIDLVPTERTNVETTWTLSKASQRSLEEQFATRRVEFAADLRAAWNALVAKDGSGMSDELQRPPCD